MSNIQQKLAEASKKAKDRDEKKYPEAWKPAKAGDQISGTVTDIHSGFGKSEDLTFWDLEKSDGTEWSVLETTGLATAREKLLIAKGDEIGIEYRGEGTTKSGRTFKKFVVVKG